MSSGYYNDRNEEPRRRSHRSKPLYEEEIVESRRTRPSRQTPGRELDVVRRRDDSSDSVEEIARDFPPGDGAYVRRKTTTRNKYAAPRARSAGRHDGRSDRHGSHYGDPRRSDPAFSDSRRGGRRKDRHGRYESESDTDSVSPPPRHRRKSLGEQALAALGIGGAAGALASGGRDRSRSRQRARSHGRGRDDYDDYRSRGYSRSRDRSVDAKKKFQQAAKAAVTAGVLEAWRVRKEPGGIAQQGKRVMTAAIGAAGIDGALDRDPNKHGTRHTLEAAIGGLASNRIINGRRESRSRSRGRHGSGSGRGGSGPGVGGLASAAGLAAIAGKAINNFRSKSRDRGRRGSYSDSSSSGSPRGHHRSRSQSVKRFVKRRLSQGMSAVGISEGSKHGKDRGHRHYSDDEDNYYPRPRGGGGWHESSSDSSSSSNSDTSDTDHYDSDMEKKKQKKIHSKELITAGLATVATIHAGHSVYQSMEKRKTRQRKVAEGKMSPEEAKKLKSRAKLQDVASIGIAALGIKGAVSEWKEVHEQREMYQHAKKRLIELREHKATKLLHGGRSSEPSMRGRYHADEGRQSYGYSGPMYQDGNPYNSSRVPPPPGARY